MTPQLVDHPYTDSCIVIGCTRCSLAEKRTRLFLVAVTSQLSYSRSEQRFYIAVTFTRRFANRARGRATLLCCRILCWHV